MHYITGIFILLSVSKTSTADDQPVANTNSGKVRGIKLDVLGAKVHAFLGIPYAIPPVGELRFRKPLPIEPWQEVYNATKKPPSCPQFSPNIGLDWIPRDNIKEDCLYLNLWVPTERTESKATVIWIHGGGFLYGSSALDLYDGRVLASKGNIIVASMNYRLGAFGFLYSGTEEAPGNVGLHDQLLAIRWIRDNLRSFGGDPSLITISGQSAGAISTAFHLISPLSRGLANRVILESGAAYNRMFALSPRVAKIATSIFSVRSGCKTTIRTPKKVLACLRNKTIEELYNEQEMMLNETLIGFIPIHGDDFLPHHPMSNNSGHQQADVLIGATADEGSVFIALRNWTLFFRERPITTRSNAEYYIRDVLRYNFDVPNEFVIKKYLDGIQDQDSDLLLKASHQAVGDNLFVCPSIFSSEKYSENSKVYYYYFTHRASRPWNMLREWMGVHHLQEIPFVLGIPLRNDSYLKEEIEFSMHIIKAWSSFVRDGVPSYDPLSGEWPQFTTTNSSYVELNPYHSRVGSDLKKDECDFWRGDEAV